MSEKIGSQHPKDTRKFENLRREHLNKGTLFEDLDFLPNNLSLQSAPMNGQIQWLRPHKIVDQPKFCVEDFSRFDVRQGQLGNCWFVAATANLTLVQELFSRVVPGNQSFDAVNYAGIFHFKYVLEIFRLCIITSNLY